MRATARSFGAQRNQRVHLGGATRGEKTREQRGGAEDECSDTERERVRGADLIQHLRENLPGPEGEQHAGRGGDQDLRCA